MNESTRLRRSGLLFIASGVVFIGVALAIRQPAVLGASAALIGVGGMFLLRARRSV